MGTTTIEAALRKMGLESKDPRTDELVAVALNELAALRASAKVVIKDKNDEYVMQGEHDNAYGLLADIAKEP